VKGETPALCKEWRSGGNGSDTDRGEVTQGAETGYSPVCTTASAMGITCGPATTSWKPIRRRWRNQGKIRKNLEENLRGLAQRLKRMGHRPEPKRGSYTPKAVNHSWMVKFMRRRIGDERVIRLVVRMLKSGIGEDGLLQASEEATPQGGYPFTTAVEHLPALCAGPLVQPAGKQAESRRSVLFFVLQSREAPIYWNEKREVTNDCRDSTSEHGSREGEAPCGFATVRGRRGPR